MQGNGGAVYEQRSTALAKVEQCLICHGTGKTADIKAVHMNFEHRQTRGAVRRAPDTHLRELKMTRMAFASGSSSS
jgi:hypothetical protein